jgi:hypothetical protein
MSFDIILLWPIEDAIHYIANLELSLCWQYICHAETEFITEEAERATYESTPSISPFDW